MRSVSDYLDCFAGHLDAFVQRYAHLMKIEVETTDGEGACCLCLAHLLDDFPDRMGMNLRLRNKASINELSGSFAIIRHYLKPLLRSLSLRSRCRLTRASRSRQTFGHLG